MLWSIPFPLFGFFICFFFFNDTATTEIYTLSLHDALPIFPRAPTTPRMATSTNPAMIARCSRNVLSSRTRSVPSSVQNRCAITVASAVNTPSAPAPSHVHRFRITSNDPPSWTKIVSALNSHAGSRPRAAISAVPPEKLSSLVSPLHQNGRHSTMRAAAAVAGARKNRPMSRSSCSRIVGCAGSIVQISECKAGTAEHAPEAPVVVGRHRAGPGVTVVMAMNAAGGGAAARVIELLAVYPFAALLTPGSVAAEVAHGRPIRHRRRRRSVEAREGAGRINDPAADNRQLGDGV